MLNDTLKKVLIVLIGFIVAVITMALIEWIGHLAYPDNDFTQKMSREEMGEVVKNMPVMALWIVGLSWMAGAFLGCFVVRGMNKEIPLIAAQVPGILMIIGGVAMLASIPHPTWFVLFSLTIAALGTYFGEKIGRKVQLGKTI